MGDVGGFPIAITCHQVCRLLRVPGMTPLSYLVADDDVLVRETIESYLAKISPHDRCVKTTDGVEALREITSGGIHAAFIDLDLPGLDGVSLLRSMPEDLPVVVVSASEEFGAQSYEFDVVDYLIKPLDFPRFARAMERVRERLTIRDQQNQTLVSPRPGLSTTRSVFVKDAQRIVRLDLEDLLYVQAESNYVRFVQAESSTMSLMTMKRAEEALPADFIRIHRSYLVNRHKISKIEGNGVFIGTQELPLSQSYRDELWEKLGVL
jgi:DNA-binding LytR/AlgR family response regulator